MHSNSSAFFMLNLCYQEHNILLLVRSLLKYFYQCTDEDHDQFWCLTDLTTRKWGNCGPDCKTKGTLTGTIFETGAYGVPSKSPKSFICGGVRQTINLKSPGKGAPPSTPSWGLQ